MKSVFITLQIIKALTNTSIVKCTSLAKHLNISCRSVYRYIDELTCYGIPINIKRGRNGGVYLDEDYKKRNYNYLVQSYDYQSKRRRKKFW